MARLLITDFERAQVADKNPYFFIFFFFKKNQFFFVVSIFELNLGAKWATAWTHFDLKL